MSREVTLRITNVNTFVESSLDSMTYQNFKKVMGFRDDRAMWRAKSIEKKLEAEGKNTEWVKKWDGNQTTVVYDKSTRKSYFPTGLLSRAREFFGDCEFNVNLVDQRTQVQKGSGYSMTEEFEPRDYQGDIKDNACNKGRGIIKMATGGGKTATAASIIAELAVEPTIFYVTSKDLLKQAQDEFQRFIYHNGSPIKVGAVGGGQYDLQPITVMTVQTAIRALGERWTRFDDEDESAKSEKQKLNEKQKKELKDFIRGSGLMMCDEVQHWAAKTCQTISSASESARYRYGLSATPWRDEGDDMLIDACFGKPICDISASFLIDRGYLIRPTIYFVHHKMPGLEGAYPTIYQEGIVENQERNLLISNISRKMVDSGRQALILVRMIEHGNILEAMTPDSFFVHGSHTGKQREAWIDRMRQREAPITIATSIFDEGVDVKCLDSLILAGSGKSQTRALQRVGRVLRPYKDEASGFVKKDAFVVDFHDNMRYMLKHSRKRRKIYETEPAFEIKDWNKA